MDIIMHTAIYIRGEDLPQTITTQLKGNLSEVWEVHASKFKEYAGIASPEKVQEEKHPLEEIFGGRPRHWIPDYIPSSPEEVSMVFRANLDPDNLKPKEAKVYGALYAASALLIVTGFYLDFKAVFNAAITQATKGKGQRHGGDKTPFLEQPWVRLYKTHGLGFLLGQADKKYHEACGKENKEDAEREFLGAIVYLGMALLVLEGKVK